MAALMAAIAIMMIFSMITFQSWEDVLRRENEAEMIFRAQEIARAIQRYRLDRQDVPRSLEDLMKPGPRGQYYLRMAYVDPLVKTGVWGLLFDGPDGTIVDLGGEINPERNLGFEDEDSRRSGEEGEEERIGPRENRGALPIGRIAGVRTLSTDEPFRVYKGFDDYSQWQFTYHDYEQDAGRGPRRGANPRPDPFEENQQPAGVGN